MNFFWSTLFFTYARVLIALIWLLVMWVLVLICAIRFYRIHHAAGWMMGILLLWTTFAASQEYEVCGTMDRCPLCGIALNEKGVCPKCGWRKSDAS